MQPFSKREVTITLTGAEWTALLGRICGNLSEESYRTYREATTGGCRPVGDTGKYCTKSDAANRNWAEMVVFPILFHVSARVAPVQPCPPCLRQGHQFGE